MKCYFIPQHYHHIDTSLLHVKAAVPYVISDLAANMPVHVVSSGTFTIILYFLCGLRKDNLATNLFIFIADNVLMQLVRSARFSCV